MTLRTTPALSALTVLSFLSAGCATKKHVREAIAPVQNQVNKTQSQVSDLQKQTAEHTQAIGDLDRQVATADEKAVDAGKRAAEAADVAAKANSAGTVAAQRADTAHSLAQQAKQSVAKLDQSLQNLDNYKLASTQQVYFAFNKSTLPKEQQAKLDDAIQKVAGMRNFIIEWKATPTVAAIKLTIRS